MYDQHIKKCKNSFSNIPRKEQIKQIVDLFLKHDRIIFCTMGKSAYACRKVVYTARSYGLNWYDLDVCHAFHGDAGIIKDKDLLVFVSKSGETKETNAVAEYFAEWETVGISSDSKSSLSKICKHHLEIPVSEEGSPFGYAPMISTTLYMVVLHAILCECIENSSIEIEDYARNHPSGKIGKMLKEKNVKNRK